MNVETEALIIDMNKKVSGSRLFGFASLFPICRVTSELVQDAIMD